MGRFCTMCGKFVNNTPYRTCEYCLIKNQSYRKVKNNKNKWVYFDKSYTVELTDDVSLYDILDTIIQDLYTTGRIVKKIKIQTR